MKVPKNSWNFLLIASRLCLYLFVAFLPFQIDALVLSSEVFYSGFYNPYLSHFIYLSDIFLICGFLFFGVGLGFSSHFRQMVKKWRMGDRHVIYAICGFLCMHILSLFWSVDVLNSTMYLLRSFEFFGLYLLIVNDFLDLRRLFYVFIGVISFEALVGISQYVLQESLGLRFFGEPIVSSGSLGVAKVTLFNAPLLRIYGTFTHPNLFAGYLVFAVLLSLHLFHENKLLFTLLVFVCVAALFLTFSRSAVLALILSICVFVFRHKNTFTRGLLLALAVFLLLSFMFGDLSSISERILYLNISIDMFKERLFGVGYGNFTSLMQNFSYVKLAPWLFQPVHNIYLLVANELGLFGFVAFIWLIWSIFSSLISGNHLRIIMPLFIAVLVIGLFDHYFLTLYQGQALFWLTIALSSR